MGMKRMRVRMRMLKQVRRSIAFIDVTVGTRVGEA
jgi:hypothetical protein